MSGQIIFYQKNKIDLSVDGVSISVTDSVASNTGESFSHYLRNRKNSSGWITTGSTDAGNTTLTVDMGEGKTLDKIIMVGHNFKNYKIKKWVVNAFVDLLTVENNTRETTFNSFDSIITDKIQIEIENTMIADSEKFMRQLILTEGLGQFNGFPKIQKPTHDTNRIITKMLSGKKSVIESVGAFSCNLTVDVLSDKSDLELIESLYYTKNGFLMSLSGEMEDQFRNKLLGYRDMDIYLMKCTNNYTPEFFKHCYQLGAKVDMKLEEIV